MLKSATTSSIFVFLLVTGAGPAVPALAATVTATVLGTAGPWDRSVNPALYYGDTDGGVTAPTVVTGGLDFSAGSELDISFVGDGISIGPGYALTGPAGYNISYPPSSGFAFPSNYTSGPYNVGELIGAFANSSGVVVGSPFVVGTGGIFSAPTGASELLLGINDDDFGNNSGAFVVAVSNVPVSNVPVPPAAPMFGAALVALGAVGHRLKRRKVTAR